MKIVMDAHAVGGVFESPPGFAIATVKMDLTLIRYIRAKLALFARLQRDDDGQLSEIRFLNCDARFGKLDMQARYELRQQGKTWARYDGDGFEAERTEGDELVVINDRFWWTCRPKHGDEIIETESFDTQDLYDWEKLIEEGGHDSTGAK